MQRFLYGVLLVGLVFDVYEGLYLLSLIDARRTLDRESTSLASKTRLVNRAFEMDLTMPSTPHESHAITTRGVLAR